MKYEDDLMYASEAIQKIASEAMQRVENLYKLRFSVPRDPDNTPTRTTPVVSETPQTPDISVTETLRAPQTPEKIDSSFDLVDNFMHNIPKSKPTVKPNLKPVSVTPIDHRPEKIDSNLHGLTL
nr:MAG TPA: hypothetical protein [Caudoviricetes sp.]